MQPATIAIDGPAASGKSTAGQRVAERLAFLYFDTGAMYRALTFLALQQGVALGDNEALGVLAAGTPIEIETPAVDDGRQYTVGIGGEDVTWEIRQPLVDQNVSQVAAHPAVRSALLHQQRRIGLRGSVVMVGRDIGTVVLPEAPLKVYLDASLEERARRRWQEMQERGEQADYDLLLADMRRRDHQDSTRLLSPLRPAPDAHRINCSTLPVDEVVEQVLLLAEMALGVQRPAEVRE